MFALIGKTLKHSFSKEIHESLFNDEYKLIELDESKFDSFMKNKQFKAINVTVPYKEKVIPYLSYMSENAKKINAVNVIINRNNELFGYNTDYFGFRDLLMINNIDVTNKNVLILGSGGTSKTVKSVIEIYSPKKVQIVSRTYNQEYISYERAKEEKDTQIIINTTPVGMYPNIDEKIIDIDCFPFLEAVVDVIYNPLETRLIKDAKNRGIKCASGLYMLVAQAIYACELFHNVELDKNLIKDVYLKLKKEKQNIVLVGMPTSGKTTIGRLLNKELNREFIDSDDALFNETGLSPKEFILKFGIDEFRSKEEEIIKKLSLLQNKIIATGGGVVLNKENIDHLRSNGVIIFLDRPLDKLYPNEDRPLSNNKDDLFKLFNDRYEIYKSSSDIIIKNDGNINNCIETLIKEFMLYEKDLCC